MFVDKAKIKIKAGDGGDGAVSFHRENTLPQEVPTAVTEAEAEILFFRRTTIFLPLWIFVTKENMQQTGGRTAHRATAPAKAQNRLL